MRLVLGEFFLAMGVENEKDEQHTFVFSERTKFGNQKTQKAFGKGRRKRSSKRKKYKHYRIYDVEKDKKMKNVDKIFKISD